MFDYCGGAHHGVLWFHMLSYSATDTKVYAVPADLEKKNTLYKREIRCYLRVREEVNEHEQICSPAFCKSIIHCLSTLIRAVILIEQSIAGTGSG